MAAIARSTPSFSLPATQNTAPVYEFRCLYTHDVRKKAKKWHDGSARFHTFNKRVMVYDDTKNYIGDLHYRADEEFGDGVELQLDRGVLVEIGERIGTTQTDLTGVVNHHGTHGNTSVPSTNTRPQSVQRTNQLNSQGRPKSLIELLGPSQGRFGRAVIATTSPFEQRQTMTGLQAGEPALKRQRIALGKENHYHHPQPAVTLPPSKTVPPEKHAASIPVTGRSSATRRPLSQPVSEPLVNHQRTIDISSDEEPQTELMPSSMTSHRSTDQRPLQPAEHYQISEDINKKSKQAAIRKDRSQKAPKERTASSKPTKALPHIPHEQNNALADADADVVPAPSLRPGMSSLRMKSQPARRKLMYKALLPSCLIGQKEAFTPALVISNEQFDDDLLFTEAPSQVLGLQEPDESGQEDEHSQPLPVPTELPASRGAPVTPPRRSPVPQVLQPSPLFVSQTGSQKSPTPTRNFAEDDFSILATQDEDMVPVVEPDDLIDDSEIDLQETGLLNEPESPCFPLPPPKPILTKQTTPKLMPPPQPPSSFPHGPVHPIAAQRTPTPTKTRPFARSLSANDSPLPIDPRTSPFHTALNSIAESPVLQRNQQLLPLDPSPAPSVRFQPLRQPPSLSNPNPKSKSPVQRSRSDTAALIIPTSVAAPLQPDTNPDEQGPWTTLEAFLLFDKWPACKAKAKPVFAPLATNTNDDRDGNPSDEEDGFGFPPSPVRRKVPPILIRSARSFMRDGY